MLTCEIVEIQIWREVSSLLFKDSLKFNKNTNGEVYTIFYML